MKVTQEKLPHSQMGLLVEVEAERSKQAYEKLVRDYMRTANVPGFRPGKAPRQLVLQFLGKERVRVAALRELIESTLKEAIAQQQLASLGEPQLRDDFEELLGRYQPGEPLAFKAAVDVQPEVVLGEYRGLTVRYSEVVEDPGAVDRTLDDYRNRRATLIPVEDRPAEAGDSASIDFKGTREDGSEITGASGTDFSLELLPGRFIPGFTEGIVGMELGETRTLALRFPDDYPQAELAGVAANFEITLIELKRKELPELDDEFAQDISEFQTLAELRTFLESRERERAEEQTRTNRDTAVVNALVEQVSVELPETLVNREVQFLAEQTFRELQQQGIDPNRLFTEENLPRLRDGLRNDAEARLKRTLALAQVARQENLQVEEAAVATRAGELAASVSEGVSPEALFDYAREELLTEKILEWLVAHSTIEVVPTDLATGEAAEEAAEPEAPSVSEGDP